MEEKPLNNNISMYNQKKIIKNLLKFPSFISNEELRHIRKRFKINFSNIQNNHLNLQENNIFKSTKKDDIAYRYVMEISRLKEEEKNKKQILKKKSLSKKILKEKIKIKRKLSSINRKELEDLNKGIPSNLFDFIHPYEYLLNNKKFKSTENSITNKNDMSEKKSVKYLILKNQKGKNQKCLNDLFLKHDEIKNNNEKNSFLIKPKRNSRRINSTYSAKILFENNNFNIFNKSQDKNICHLNNSSIFTKYKISIQDEEINPYENINYKTKINKDNDKNKSRNELCNNKYNTIFNKIGNIINNKDINKFNEFSLSPQSTLNNTINNNINNNDLLIKRNLFYKNSIGFKKNKKLIPFTESNKIIYRNKNSLNLSTKSFKRKRVLSPENSIKTKKLLKVITDINDNLKNIKNSFEFNQDDDNKIHKNFNTIKKVPKADILVLDILKEEREKIQFESQSAKEIFEKMKQKNFISELTKQYFTHKKDKYETSVKNKFLKRLKKVDLLEKKEAELRNYAYKKYYKIRKNINKLIENDLSKERKKFDEKTIIMRQMNNKNLKSFIQSINKYK